MKTKHPVASERRRFLKGVAGSHGRRGAALAAGCQGVSADAARQGLLSVPADLRASDQAQPVFTRK